MKENSEENICVELSQQFLRKNNSNIAEGNLFSQEEIIN